MSAYIPELHIVLYLKIERKPSQENAIYARAYKYLDKPKNKTSSGALQVYSYKAKRYVWAYLYPCEWDGSQNHSCHIERQILRYALRRVCLDIR
jgi:hypothetical protein